MEVYGRVRRAVQVDGMSVRQAAREFGLSRKTIRKMLAFSAPPGYQRKKPVRRPKLGPWLGLIDQILVKTGKAAGAAALRSCSLLDAPGVMADNGTNEVSSGLRRGIDPHLLRDTVL